MQSRKFQETLVKEDGIICFTCKKESHYYCQGITENGFSRMANNKKNKWDCNECKVNWEDKKGAIQNVNDKTKNIQQLIESVQFMNIKFDQFNIIFEKILNEIKEIREQNMNHRKQMVNHQLKSKN